MPPRTDLVMFLDLECTGSGDSEEIVEVGIVLLETGDWQEVGFYTHVVEPSEDAYQRMMVTDVVREMHLNSGLLADIDHYRNNLSGLATVQMIDIDVKEWLEKFVGKDTTHIPYGGSGVSWYDRKFIKRDMPLLNRHITYWALEVGSAERMFKLAGVPWYDGVNKKAHRALDDARFHADEFRYVLNQLKQLRQT